MVRDALQERFDAVRREELERLRRKLVGLSDHERQSAETIIADVIAALAEVSSQALVDSHPPETLQAIVRLFALESARDAA
jgi:1,6-anhydro-N-acetylmuramate kinase